jgi:YebC/PmpR family DNA-binding regulatory protein
MSGHSKWSTIKHKKGAADAKRGKTFTKLIKEITVSARMGGGDPNANPRLRSAIAAAKAENMPKDNIERAVKRGTGELEGTIYEETVYEGYGPGGVAVLIESLTDNKNRTVADIRHLLSKHAGSMGEAGCVAWMFSKKGFIAVDKSKVDEEKLMEIALEAGAEDISEGQTEFEILTGVSDLEEVRKALDRQGIPVVVAEVTMVPKSTVQLDKEKAQQMLKLMDVLEDSDDVQHVYANFDISDEVMEALS